jgi:hypothetical protein
MCEPWAQWGVGEGHFWKICVVPVICSLLFQFCCASARDSGTGTEAVLRLSFAVVFCLDIGSILMKFRAWSIGRYRLKPFTLHNYNFSVINTMKNVQRVISSINIHRQAIVLCFVPSCNGFAVRSERLYCVPKSWYVLWSTACSTVNVCYPHGRR